MTNNQATFTLNSNIIPCLFFLFPMQFSAVPSTANHTTKKKKRKKPKLMFSSSLILGKQCITSSSLTMSRHLHKQEQRETSDSGFPYPIFWYGQISTLSWVSRRLRNFLQGKNVYHKNRQNQNQARNQKKSHHYYQ